MPKKEKYESNVESMKILLDYSWQKYHKQNQYFESLDSKSATMTSFVGLLFSVVAGFVYYILTDAKLFSLVDNCWHTIIFIALSAILILSITTSFYLSLTALGIQKVTDPASISDAKKFFQRNEQTIKHNQRKLMIYMIKSLENSEISFKHVNLAKADKIKHMTFWLKFSIILIIVNIVFVLFVFFNK